MKSVDVYGQRISINFRGKSEFNTFFGGIVSIVVGILILSYCSVKMVDLFTHQNYDWQRNTIRETMSKYGDLYARENIFDFAFGFIEIRTWEYVEPPAGIFDVAVRRTDLSIRENIRFTKNPIGFTKCS